MPLFPNMTLAILAGGKASRMEGKNKALLEIDGETFINRIHRNLSPLFHRTIIISNEVKDFQIPTSQVFADLIENIGPLGGIHSALANSTSPYVFIVSCDMPFADPEIAKLLLEEFNKTKPDILMPVVNSFNEPLFAIYSKHLEKKIVSIASASNGKSIKELFKNTNISFLSLPNNSSTKKCFTNINSNEDFQAL